MDQLREFMEKLPRTTAGMSMLSDPWSILRPSKRSSRSSASSYSRARDSQKRSKRGDKGAKPLQFTLEGTLEPGKDTLYSVNGHDLVTTADTWVFGELAVGAKAKVKGVIVRGHDRMVTSIIANQ